MDSSLQRQARALGDPTRHQIFRYIVDSDRPVDVAELTEHLRLNHNAIRQHLAKLTAAGLILEGTAPVDGRGRPRLTYTLAPTAESRWDVTGPYERLSLMLTEIIRSGDSPVDVGKRVGKRRNLTASLVGDPVASLTDQMARHGFEPSVRTKGQNVDIVLQHCPFATTAVVDPDSVCGLHLGIAQGLAEKLGGVAIDELRVKDPRRAHCVLRLHTVS